MAGAPEKSSARLMAVQALYSMDISGENASDIEKIAEGLAGMNKREAKEDRKFFKKVVDGVLENSKTLDEKIAKLLDAGWSIERLSPLLKAILRAGIYEMDNGKTPAKIIISEYVMIAGRFFENGKETGFVNAVLDKVNK